MKFLSSAIAIAILCFTLVPIVSASASATASDATATASLAQESQQQQQQPYEVITCTNPFTLLPNHNARVNDNYCDCINGIDEPLTDACSGVDHWAGARRGSSLQDNDDDNDGDEDSAAQVSKRFKCPQQNLYLSPSRINDGICDCCCGSDERGIEINDDKTSSSDKKVVCEDKCEEVLREQRMQREKILKNFELGYSERNQRLEEFQVMVDETFEKIAQMEQQVEPLETFVKETSEAIQKQQQELVVQYLEYARETTQSILKKQDEHGFFQVLVDKSWDEKVEFLAGICQWYGEMTLATMQRRRQTFCEPLKMAALDAGILWDGGDVVQVPKGWGEELVMPLLSRIGYTSQDEIEREDKEWKDPEDEILNGEYYDHHDDDTYDGDREALIYDDDDHDEEDHDEDDHDENENHRHGHADMKKKHLRRRHRRHGHGHVQSNDSNAQDPAFSEQGTNNYIHDFQSIFGKIMRSNFHQQAKDIISILDSIMKSQEHDEAAVENDHEMDGNSEETESSSLPSIDPMAIQMVRNTLSSRIGQIEYGDILAKSTHSMLRSLKDHGDIHDLNSRMDTILLSAINYSNISEVDAEEILAVVTATNISSETCFSPYIALCNDPATTKKESIVQRCAERKDVTFCTARSPDASFESPKSIPSHVPDGFLNYYVPKARGTDDEFTHIFQAYNNLASSMENTKTPQLDQDLHKAKKEAETIQNQIQQTKDDLGLMENQKIGPKYGTNGELYALRNQCFSITSGKYTYEVCLFGRAYQREGSAKTGGTDLGKWNGSSMDDITGTRVWKWTGGAKCWNGPSRSATVFVTCGSETTLISADEPNICEYEFRMESYIACDDRYKLEHDL
eukprot:CAMPEP_0176485406 /NCGR_PEP_ID=MMETSP0200_2-20121128/5021_1 /TAXON_ID=947934 /ORGANISM="Chaetoceros sp., Strain GSL56" /LENGTH=852 /DNA_ID=CAMNT_0017882045 /DNA_START=92 /DNA_END=2653 /DNA_ORIENTATION=-